MFKTDPRLFFEGSNNASKAKPFINECKRFVNGNNFPGSEFSELKTSIINCDINGLINRIDSTKKNLIELDASFAEEYMNALNEYRTQQSLDISHMSEEEKNQYYQDMTRCDRDYNTTLLYMLESNEESLIPEMKEYLEFQRMVVSGYEIEDKMAVLPLISEEYINLYKEKAELDKDLIRTNPNLTSEEKEELLTQYDIQYQSQLKAYEDAYKQKVETEALQEELAELESQKTNNNGFFHPLVESELDEAIINTKAELGYEDAIAYQNMNGWERAWENTKTFTTSTVFGIGGVVEDAVDGGVMVAGMVGDHFGADTQWAEDFISIHYAEDAYEGLVVTNCLNEISAYSSYHTIGNMTGTTLGYVGLSFLPGGKATAAVTGGLAAAGNSAERALDSGATFDEAAAVGSIAGIAGAAAGYGVGGGITSGAQSMGQVGIKTFQGAALSAAEPLVNTTAEYIVYANDMKDSEGNAAYDNILDYFVESGGLTNTVMAFGIGGITSAAQSFGGYKQYKMEMDTPVQTKVTNATPDAQSPKTVSVDGEDDWINYREIRKQYTGRDGAIYSVDPVTGEKYVSFMDPDAARINGQIELEKAREISGWIDITEPKALKWSYDSNTGKLGVDVDWPPYGGIDPQTIKTLDQIDGDVIMIDRFGPTTGGIYALIPSDGDLYTLDQRSIFNNLSSPNPNVSGYRQIEFNKGKYMVFCDGADDIVSYCRNNGIDYSTAIMDPNVQQKINGLTSELGLENPSIVTNAIFGEKGSYISDLALKDNTHYYGGDLKASAWRDDIVGIEASTGKSSKYGYAGVAAPWATPNGEVIASGGAYQFNLRTSETTLNSLGILNSSPNMDFMQIRR